MLTLKGKAGDYSIFCTVENPGYGYSAQYACFWDDEKGEPHVIGVGTLTSNKDPKPSETDLRKCLQRAIDQLLFKKNQKDDPEPPSAS